MSCGWPCDHTVGCPLCKPQNYDNTISTPVVYYPIDKLMEISRPQTPVEEACEIIASLLTWIPDCNDALLRQAEGFLQRNRNGATTVQAKK